MKKKIKQGISLSLAGLLLVSSLAGCGKTNESTSNAGNSAESTESKDKQSGSGTTLDMAWWGNQVRNERTQEALAKYHELDDSISVNGQFFQWDDYWSKLATLAAGKKLPDIVQMDLSYISPYVEKGQLLDLTPYIESGAIDTSNITEDVLNMGKIGEGIYGLVAGVNAPCLFYNKTLLDEQGIEIKDNTTIDEFAEIAKEVQSKTGYKANLITSAHGVDMDIWSRANGLRVTEKKLTGEKAEDYVPYFEILKNGIDEGWHASPEYITDSSSIEQSPLVYGSSPETMVWCTMNSSNMLTGYQSAAPEGTEIAITTIPSDDPKQSNYLKAGMYFSISANCSNVDEAVKVLNYLINSKEANEILLGERGIPASTKVSDDIAPLISETDQIIMTYVNEVVAKNSSPMGPAAPDGSSEVSDLANKLEEKVGYGEYTPEEAAKDYFEKGNEIYKSK